MEKFNDAPSVGEASGADLVGGWLERLGRLRRLADFLIEIGIWYFVAGYALGMAAGVLGFGEQAQDFEEQGFGPMGGVGITLAMMALRTLYRGLMVQMAGGTLGHLAVGGRVADAVTGAPASARQAWTRALLSLLDLFWLPLIVNCLMVLFRGDRRHFYDHTAGTAVVRFREGEDGS